MEIGGLCGYVVVDVIDDDVEVWVFEDLGFFLVFCYCEVEVLFEELGGG